MKCVSRIKFVCVAAASVGACASQSLTTENFNTIAACGAGFETSFAIDLEGAWKGSGGQFSAGYREAVRAAFVKHMHGGDFTATYIAYTECVRERFNRQNQPDLSGSITLFAGTPRNELHTQISGSMLSEKSVDGFAPRYRATTENSVTKILPQLGYLDGLKSAGPILPIDNNEFAFPPPTLGVLINNPRLDSVVIKSIDFKVLDRKLTGYPWLSVNSPSAYDATSKSLQPVALTITDFGWANISQVMLDYNILIVSESELIKSVPEVFDNINGEWRYRGSFPPNPELSTPFETISYSTEFSHQKSVSASGRGTRKFRFDIGLDEFSGLSEGEFGFLYGWAHTTNERGERQSFKVSTLIPYSAEKPRGPLYPSHYYNAYFNMMDSAGTVSIPVAQEIKADAQDYFIIAVETSLPGNVLFEATATLTDESTIPLGRLNLETFFTRYSGLNGQRREYESVLREF